MDLPPPPPAIHAPVPARTVNSSTPLSMNSRTVNVLEDTTRFSPYNRQPGMFMHFRYMHTKHHKGAKHRSIKNRSNKRKAARRK